MPDVPCDPVGEREIADRLGLARGTIHKWRQRGQLPAPEFTISGQPAWNWATVVDARLRHNRRPRKEPS